MTDPTQKRPWRLAIAAFIIIAIIAVASLRLMGPKNPLTTESLDVARGKWASAHIQNYDLFVTVTGSANETYDISVRSREVTEALRSGQPFSNLQKALPWTVPGLFEILAMDLDRDSKPDSPSAYTDAQFHEKTGHLIRYVRATHGQAIEINVKLEEK